MRLRFFVLVAILAVAVIGLNIPAVNAQPQPKFTWGDGNTFDPYANVRVWTGIGSYDKDYTGTGDSDMDTYVGFTGGGTEFGIRIKVGKMSCEGSINTKYNAQDDGGGEDDTWSTPNVGAQYAFTEGGLIGFGAGYDMWMANKGDCPALNTVKDDGFRGYQAGGGGMYLGAAYKGAFFAIFNQGYDGGTLVDANAGPGHSAGVDYIIPRLTAGYATPGAMNVGGFVYFQSVKIDDEGSAVDGESVMSYILGANFDLHGPLTIHAHADYWQNAGNAGWGGGPTICAVVDGDKIENTTGYNINAAAAYKIGNIEPAGGVAYKLAKNSTWAEDDPAMEIFARVGISIQPGFTVFPGVSYEDLMDNSSGDPEGTAIQVGIFWEAMF